MTDEFALQLLRHMVETPSFSGSEEALAASLVREMEGLGFHSYIDEAGNAVGELGPAGAPLIVLLGHMDTVSGWVPVRQEGDLLYGRGSVDAKGALATFICSAARAARPDCRFVVVGAVEEETPGSKGAHHMNDRYRPDAVIIGEPSGWSNVVLGYKGRVGIHFEAARPQSHPAGPGEKAVEAAVRFWNQFEQHLASQARGQSLFHNPLATLVSLEGTCEHARLTISCRTPPDYDLEALQRFCLELGGSDTVRFDEVTAAVVSDRSVAPARALVGAIRRHGGTPGYKVKTGTSDMNVVAKGWKAPMVAYGPGDSTLDHTPDEHIDLNEYLRAVAVLAEGLGSLATELAETAAAKGAGEGFTPEEEQELTERLKALGYVD